MSLLSRLFNAKTPKVLNLDEQIRGLESHTQEQLLGLINSDQPDPLREAAIARLTYSKDLLHLALNDEAPRMRTSARKRIGQLLDQGAIGVEQLVKDVEQPLDLVKLAGFSQAASLHAVNAIQDPALLLQLACEGSTAQVRQAAAARVESRGDLEKLCKAAQGKDKAVYRLAKTKLDVFKAEDARAAEAQKAVIQLCEKLEKLSRLDADPIFKAKIALLESEWRLVADIATPGLRQRYEQALAVCQQQIATRAEHIAQEEEKIAMDQQATAFLNTAVDESARLIEELYGLETLSPESAAVYQQQLNDLTNAVRLATHRDLPMKHTLNHFEQAREQANLLLQDYPATGTLIQLTNALATADKPSGEKICAAITRYLAAAQTLFNENPPQVVLAAERAMLSWRNSQTEAEKTRKNLIKDVQELARKGLHAAQQGMVRKARGTYKEIQEKREHLTDLPAALAGKIADLETAIARLSDWHEFAVTPKKEALITQMQALVQSSLSPADRATRIHELQDEWKSLSRGVQQADENLWQQFQAASQQAYAPCKEYFDQQARLRDENLDKRRTLISQLETYLSHYHWEQAVWSDVEQTLKVARQEWQGYWPLPRKAAEELQPVFDNLMDQLYQKLKAHYQHNKTAKQQLLEAAKSCADNENLQQAIDQIKRLQSQWKTLGKTFPKEDQSLWHSFRKHCDAVFARRTEEIEQANQQRQGMLARAQELIAQAHQAYELPAEELLAQDAIGPLKAAFDALELPKEDAKKLTAEFKQVLMAITNKIARQRNQAAIRSWQDLFSAGNLIRQYEVALLHHQPHQELAKQITELLDNPPPLPQGGLPLLQQRMQQAAALTSVQQQENKLALRLLCVRAEILCDRETPDADKSLRMNYLMQQLQRGLGQTNEALENLVFEWIALGGVADEDYTPLWIRFMECLSQGEKTITRQ